QALELVEEHDAGNRPVAVDHGPSRERLLLERRRDQRQDGRDARPGGYRDGASGSLGLDVDRELTYRWHHIHDVARLQHVVGMVGEDTAREPLDPDPELPGACGSTDRVRATHVLAVDEEAHRDVLAGDVSE